MRRRPIRFTFAGIIGFFAVALVFAQNPPQPTPPDFAGRPYTATPLTGQPPPRGIIPGRPGLWPGLRSNPEYWAEQALMNRIRNATAPTLPTEEQCKNRFRILEGDPEIWAIPEPISESAKKEIHERLQKQMHNSGEADNPIIHSIVNANAEGRYADTRAVAEHYLKIFPQRPGGPFPSSNVNWETCVHELATAYNKLGESALEFIARLQLSQEDKGYLLDEEPEILTTYFTVWAEKKMPALTPPAWVRALSPDRPSIVSTGPIVYRMTFPGYRTEGARRVVGGAKLFLEAAPGWLFDEIEVWAEGESPEFGRFNTLMVMNLEPLNPHENASSMATFRPAPRHSDTESSALLKFKYPWPAAVAYLYLTRPGLSVHKWRITARFVKGSHEEAFARFVKERAPVAPGRVYVTGVPATDLQIQLDDKPNKYAFLRGGIYADDIAPGRHTAVISHPKFAGRKVAFEVAPKKKTEIGAALESGWTWFSVPGLPADLGPGALAPLPGGGVLLVASRAGQGGNESLYGWVSNDLTSWTALGVLSANVPNDVNQLPALCPSIDGRIMLFWKAGSTLQLQWSATLDGRNWDPAAALTPHPYSYDAFGPPTAVQTRAGDFLIVDSGQRLRGRPGAWGVWLPLAFEDNPTTGFIQTPDLLEAADGTLYLAWCIKNKTRPSPYRYLEMTGTIEGANTYVASSLNGDTWSRPALVGSGYLPHLIQSGRTLWLTAKSPAYLQAWCSRDGLAWQGPTPISTANLHSYPGDIAPLGGNRFVSLDCMSPDFAKTTDFVTLHLGFDLPDALASRESGEYRWEEFTGAVMNGPLHAGDPFVWTHGGYGGLVAFDKREGGFYIFDGVRVTMNPYAQYISYDGSVISKNPQHTVPDPQPVDVMAIAGNELWYKAHGDGLFCVNQTDRLLLFHGDPKAIRAPAVTALAIEPAFVWIGSAGGLEVYNRIDKNWLSFDFVPALKGLAIRSLAADLESLWIGTRNGAALRFNKVDQVTSPVQWTEKKRPQSIQKLLLEGRSLWIVGHNGVWRHDITSGSTEAVFTNIGLLSDVAMDDQYLWIAEMRNLWRFPKSGGEGREVAVNADAFNRPNHNRINQIAVDDKHIYLTIEGTLVRAKKSKVQLK
jgi:hypothetical protein